MADQDWSMDMLAGEVSEDILNVLHVVHDRYFAEIFDRSATMMAAEINNPDFPSSFGRGMRPVVKDPLSFFVHPGDEKEGIVVLSFRWNKVHQQKVPDLDSFHSELFQASSPPVQPILNAI